MIGSHVCLAAALLSTGSPPEPVHPWVATVEQVRTAREAGDVETLVRLHAPDARIWFGEKEGPGIPLEPTGDGPWAKWDRAFGSESEVLELSVGDDAVRLTVREINDWFRLVERPASRYFITYRFDEAHRILEKWIHSIPGEPERDDRLGEFEAWARASRPGLLERLLPEGRIDPSRPGEWKAALLAWRADSGLPTVPLADESSNGEPPRP